MAITGSFSRARPRFPLAVLLALILQALIFQALILQVLIFQPGSLAAEERRFTAIEIVDGDTLVLEDGREVRLVGIQAPKLPLGRVGFETWPLAEEAKAALARLTEGRPLRLAYGGRAVDRYGRQLAHLYAQEADGSETWIQGALLAEGLARVYSFADNRSLVEEMLDLEIAARNEGLGIWAHPFYALRSPEGLADYEGGFELVEGRVRAAAEVKGRVYLNFGEDWREDFTVVLQPKVRRLFEREGLDPLEYEFHLIRVRGWVKSFNGPMIEVTHPEQIEVLEP